MRRLHHFALNPASRKVRILLKEKGLDFELQPERPWERREELLLLNPASEVPVLVEPDGVTVCEGNAICEFLEEGYPRPPLIGTDPVARAEVRRLVGWFDGKFAREVTANLLDQKILRRLSGTGGPDSQAIRAGLANVHPHLDYIAWLTDRRGWLAGAEFSLADIAAASHLSAIDYLGDVPWDRHVEAKTWYQRVKSRPSFRPLLADQVPGMPPPLHYADLDF
jgi:glutathione S-transferase